MRNKDVNAGENKMTYLLTWGMGPREVM